MQLSNCELVFPPSCLLFILLWPQGLTPPLGWRSFNAFWGIVDQVKMEGIMDAMVSRSRTVGGKPTSLADLGYTRVGLDGGWNYCFPENKTFHLADGTPGAQSFDVSRVSTLRFESDLAIPQLNDHARDFCAVRSLVRLGQGPTVPRQREFS
eukprot:SAG11_NODE_192_length_12931_cov_5.747682_10_plen_152_part_00